MVTHQWLMNNWRMEKYWLWMKEDDIWYSMHMLSINHEQAREDKAPLLAEKPEAWNISKRWRKHQKLINQVDVGVDLEEHDTPWNPQQIKNHQCDVVTPSSCEWMALCCSGLAGTLISWQKKDCQHHWQLFLAGNINQELHISKWHVGARRWKWK